MNQQEQHLVCVATLRYCHTMSNCQGAHPNPCIMSGLAPLVQVLADGSLFASLSHQPEVQQQVVAKQLAALNKALALLHSHQ